MQVRFTGKARVQFLEGLSFIKQDRPTAARQFKDKALQILKRLEQFPESGRVIPEYPELPHREVVVKPYRFFYRVMGSTVWVVAVWHGAQMAEEPEH